MSHAHRNFALAILREHTLACSWLEELRLELEGTLGAWRNSLVYYVELTLLELELTRG